MLDSVNNQQRHNRYSRDQYQNNFTNQNNSHNNNSGYVGPNFRQNIYEYSNRPRGDGTISKVQSSTTSATAIVDESITTDNRGTSSISADVAYNSEWPRGHRQEGQPHGQGQNRRYQPTPANIDSSFRAPQSIADSKLTGTTHEHDTTITAVSTIASTNSDVGSSSSGPRTAGSHTSVITSSPEPHKKHQHDQFTGISTDSIAFGRQISKPINGSETSRSSQHKGGVGPGGPSGSGRGHGQGGPDREKGGNHRGDKVDRGKPKNTKVARDGPAVESEPTQTPVADFNLEADFPSLVRSYLIVFNYFLSGSCNIVDI